MVIEEFQTVALLDEVAVRIVSERNTIFSCSATSCIVGEGVAVKGRKLSAVFPSSRLASVGRGVANQVILERFVVVRHELIAVIGIRIELAGAVKKMELARGLGSNRIFVLCQNIAIIIICPSGRFAKGHIVLARQAAECIVFVAAGRAAVFAHLDDIAHRVILVLQAVAEDAARGKSDGRGQGSGVVAELDVGDLFLRNAFVVHFHRLARVSAEHVGVGLYRDAVDRGMVGDLGERAA